MTIYELVSAKIDRIGPDEWSRAKEPLKHCMYSSSFIAVSVKDYDDVGWSNYSSVGNRTETTVEMIACK